MGRKIDLIGQRFGRLIVMEEAESVVSGSRKRTRFLCECKCGTMKIIRAADLRSGDAKSCGCLQKEFARVANFKHGHCSKKETKRAYGSWNNMIKRCSNLHNKQFKDYGGRGITVCDRWKDSFENFLVDMGERPKGLTLERVDNNGDYEPNNCRWATHLEQSNNRRYNVNIWTGKICINMKQFAKAYGISYRKFYRLFRQKGLPIEEILLQVREER